MMLRTLLEYVIHKGVFCEKQVPTLVQSLPTSLSYWILEMLWGWGWGPPVSWSPVPFCSIPQEHSQICWLSRMFQGRPLTKRTCRVSGPLSHIHPISLVFNSSQQALVYIILFHPFFIATLKKKNPDTQFNSNTRKYTVSQTM